MRNEKPDVRKEKEAARIRPPAVAHVRFQQVASEMSGLGLADVFTRIQDTNLWGSDESRSGLGSAIDATAGLREAIPRLLASLGARSLLDVPCGDFGWLSQCDLADIEYTGADIVTSIVSRNQERYAGARRRFVQADLTTGPLPRADIVLCRDCLVHLSFANIRRALEVLEQSGSTYLLTTTFTEHGKNEDCVDGDWRMLNLQAPPFGFPEPIASIVEGCTEGGGAYADKTLALWRISDIVAVRPRT
jgi:hypothetical protein